MSARRLDVDVDLGLSPLPNHETKLALSPCDVRIHRNGIEFRAATAIPLWTEMTVDLESPRDGKRIHCRGIVVACNDSRTDGYVVSMVFLNLSKQSQLRLNSLV